jgi:mono/diheme cytochrome c family protein
MRPPSRRTRCRTLPPVGPWLAVLGTCLAVGPVAAAGPEAQVDYNRDIRPILSKNCYACHGQDEAQRARTLRLDLREAAVAELPSGATAIVPGSPDDSELLLRITETDETLRMPPRKAGDRLAPAEVALLRRWIAQGAPYAEHWAFVPPRALPLPAVADRSWPRSGIDSWVLARLEQEGLAPAPEADRFALLRRASLDLRGLPPSPRSWTPSPRTTHPTPTRGPSTASWTTRPTASAGPASGSTWPGTPTRRATAPTPCAPSGATATGSSTPSTATCPTTASPSSNSPATCSPPRRRRRGWPPRSTATR